MKLARFLFVAVLGAGLALSSCSDDNNDLDNGSGGGGQTGGDAYFAVNIEMSKASNLRAYGDLENATADESKVNEVRVVLYDPISGIAKKVWDYTSTIDASTGSIVKKITAAQKVEKGNYDMLVLVNPTSEMKTATATVGTNTKLDFENAVAQTNESGTVTKLIGGSSDSFAMTNTSGYVKILATDNCFQPTDVEAQNALNAKPAQVDRMVSKITVKNGLSTSVATNFKWIENNINKNTYWMRRFANIAKKDINGVPLAAGDQGRMEVAGDYSSAAFGRGVLYATDPNFTAAENTTARADNEFVVNTVTTRAADALAYVTENTMAAAEQMRDVTTSVVISLNYLPSGFAAGATYYVYNGNKYINQAEMTAYAGAAGDGSNGTVGTGDFAGINAVIAEAVADSKLVDGTVAFSLTSTSGKTLSCFKEGISFYNVPIRHFNNDMESVKQGYGRYGVVRNNFYKLTVNSVAREGNPVFPEESFEDDTEYRMSVIFEIMPWYVREQGVDL